MSDLEKKLRALSQNAAQNEAGGSYLYDSKHINDEDEEEGGSSGGSGGQTGEIEFHYQDAMALPKRDDLLPPDEIRRLLAIHKDIHKERVDTQKATREQRAALKEGRYVAPTVQQQLGMGGGAGGGMSRYKKHPVSDSAQFSGIDKQVIGLPSLNESETNKDLKDQLENRLENKYRNTPKFNPRPRPPGG